MAASPEATDLAARTSSSIGRLRNWQNQIDMALECEEFCASQPDGLRLLQQLKDGWPQTQEAADSAAKLLANMQTMSLSLMFQDKGKALSGQQMKQAVQEIQQCSQWCRSQLGVPNENLQPEVRNALEEVHSSQKTVAQPFFLRAKKRAGDKK